MKRLDAHSKLLSLLCFLLLAPCSLVALSGCGASLMPDQKTPSASTFENYDQVVDAFDQIVPGMTHAEDLPNLGFDTSSGHVDVLSYRNIETRFLAATGREQQGPAVQACIRAELYCTGYVFHPGRSERWSADVILLVMNGRVVHKVFSANPHRDNSGDLRLAQAAGNAPSY